MIRILGVVGMRACNILYILGDLQSLLNSPNCQLKPHLVQSFPLYGSTFVLRKLLFGCYCMLHTSTKINQKFVPYPADPLKNIGPPLNFLLRSNIYSNMCPYMHVLEYKWVLWLRSLTEHDCFFKAEAWPKTYT